MRLWVIVADTGGAHEAECVYSIWTTRAGADAEMVRLEEASVPAGCYSGKLYVVEVEADQESDVWID